jgi:hypothetical protein
MKTTIAIPDPLFREAEEYAHTQGLSRSELYVRALRQYLRMHQGEGIIDALNKLYESEPSRIESDVKVAQARALSLDQQRSSPL